MKFKTGVVPLRYALAIVVLLVALLTNSCASPPLDVSTLAPQTFHLDASQVIRMDVNTGEVRLTGSQGGGIEVLATLTSDPALVYKLEQTSAGLHIFAQYPKRILPPPAPHPINLEIRIPAGYQVQFDTQDANLVVQNYSGGLDVSSVSGDVLVEGLNGIASVKANRGDVTMRTSQGELYVLGNYGLLGLDNLHGQVNASTIMGTIRYRGVPQRGDAVHFESDHGPVEINLAGPPNLQVKVHSNSGDVICMFASLDRDIRNCAGMLGDGSAHLDVRTVSGAITFQQVP